MKSYFDHFRCIFRIFLFLADTFENLIHLGKISSYILFLFDVPKMPTAKHGIVSGNVNDEEYLNGFYADHG